jgi:hypothetical protein
MIDSAHIHLKDDCILNPKKRNLTQRRMLCLTSAHVVTPDTSTPEPSSYPRHLKATPKLNRLARFCPRPHAVAGKSPAPTLRRRHSPPLLHGAPLHAWRRQPRKRRVISRALPLDQLLLVRNKSHTCHSLPLALLHFSLALRFLLLELDDERLEVRFGGGCGAVVHGCPGVRIRGERVGAVLQKHTQRFEFAGGRGVVQRRVAGYVAAGEDRRAVEDQCGDEVQGAGAGFAGEHELAGVSGSRM